MTGPTIRVETAESEAAAWHARLGARNVSTGTIEEFFAWRAVPANAEAYRRVEKVWTDTGKLADDPAILEALNAAMSRKTGTGRSRAVPRGLLGLAAVGAAAALAMGGWAWMQSRTVFVTGVGEQRVVQLADGSSIRLDTGSRVRVRFAGDQRLVDLERGQALFTVAHDRARPFVVQAGGTQVTAVGTVFDVRRDAAAVSVTLVSGVVDVAPAGEGRAVQRMVDLPPPAVPARHRQRGRRPFSRCAGRDQLDGRADRLPRHTSAVGRGRSEPVSDGKDRTGGYLTGRRAGQRGVQDRRPGGLRLHGLAGIRT